MLFLRALSVFFPFALETRFPAVVLHSFAIIKHKATYPSCRISVINAALASSSETGGCSAVVCFDLLRGLRAFPMISRVNNKAMNNCWRILQKIPAPVFPGKPLSVSTYPDWLSVIGFQVGGGVSHPTVNTTSKLHGGFSGTSIS